MVSSAGDATSQRLTCSVPVWARCVRISYKATIDIAIRTAPLTPDHGP